jgi:hypothetical protein
VELHAVPSWFDSQKGTVVELEDDVQNVVRQVKEIDPRLHVFYNEQTDGFDIVEHCLDGAQRLVFSVRELDARVISRLHEGDTWLGGNPDHVLPDNEDFLTRMEREQEEVFDAQQATALEKVADAGERLAWALGDGKWGPGYQQSILVKKDIRGESDAS